MTQVRAFVDVIVEHVGVAEDSLDTTLPEKDMPFRQVRRLSRLMVIEVDKWVRGIGANETGELPAMGTC